MHLVENASLTAGDGLKGQGARGRKAVAGSCWKASSIGIGSSRLARTAALFLSEPTVSMSDKALSEISRLR